LWTAASSLTSAYPIRPPVRADNWRRALPHGARKLDQDGVGFHHGSPALLQYELIDWWCWTFISGR
ncbi:MAG: hypothetical protein ACR2O1_00600, partial [Boseongicola sp.]